MSEITCPKCGARQDGGIECLRCGLIFGRYRPPRSYPGRPAEPGPSDGPGGAASAEGPAASAGPVSVDPALDPGEPAAPVTLGTPGPVSLFDRFRRFYRVFRWVALGTLGLTLVLILRTAAPPQVTSDPQAPQRLETKLSRLQAAAFGAPPPLKLDEAELNSWMRTNLDLAAGPARESGGGPGSRLGGGPAPSPQGIDLNSTTNLSVEQAQSNVRDVKVHLEGDQITAYVLFNLYGKDLSLTLQGRLSVHDGYLRLSPTSMWLGSLPIPRASVDRAIGSLFDSPENRQQFRMPPDVRDLRVENGELVITYR